MNVRRTVAGAFAAASLVAGVATTASASSEPTSPEPASSEASAVEPIELEWGNWDRGTGVVGLVGQVIADHPDIQEANGIELTLSGYDSLDALYTDLARKRVDVVSAGPSAAAAMAVQGAPVRIVGTLSPTSVAILSDGRPWSAEDLEGSRIAAMLSEASSRIAVCGQPPVSTPTIRSAESACRRTSASASSVV